MTQIKMSLHGSQDALCMAQRSEVCEVDEQRFALVCTHCYHDHGATIFQGSHQEMGEVVEQAITVEKKQLHWHNSNKPMY
jgi:hypothetical protein